VECAPEHLDAFAHAAQSVAFGLEAASTVIVDFKPA
jgi:hypothetical protein